MVTEHRKRHIAKVYIQQNKTARRICSELYFTIGAGCIQQILNKTPYIQYLRPLCQLVLRKSHKPASLSFAKGNNGWNGHKLKIIIFSDEKKFNFQGADGWCGKWIGRIHEHLKKCFIPASREESPSWYGVRYNTMELSVSFDVNVNKIDSEY